MFRSIRSLLGAGLFVCAFCAASAELSAQSEPFEAPIPPAVVVRSESGLVTARAVRIERPIDFDGRLDDEMYRQTPPIDGFLQQEPEEGAPASERTEAWIFFDDRNIYVAARCWDSAPEREVLTEMRRDQNNITQNESFTVVAETLLNRRNSFFFQSSPLG